MLLRCLCLLDMHVDVSGYDVLMTEICSKCIPTANMAGETDRIQPAKTGGLFKFCCCSVIKSYPTLCDPVDGSTPGSLPFTISRSLPKFMSIESVRPSNHLILLWHGS